MKKKLLRFGALMMTLCMVSGCMVFADTTDTLTELPMTSVLSAEADDEDDLEAPDESIASTKDGLLIDGESVADEEEYLEIEAETEKPKTHEASSSSYSMLDSITDSNGQYNGYDVYTVEDAAKYCIDLMKDHTTTAPKRFLVAAEYSVSELGTGSPYNYAYNAYTDAFADAFNDSLFVDGKGGDYLLYSMYGRPFQVTSSCKYFTSGDTGIALVYATPTTATYYTTASQESQYTTKAASAVSTIQKNAGGSSASDYDKVCAVYDYIVDNVEYDYDSVGSSSYTMYTAYGALCNGKAVCQGYANLFYYLCNELGVPCRIVAGTGYTGSASGPHAWNIVKMGDKWYHVDVTWGDSYSTWYAGRYFFLQSEYNFVNGHNGTSHVMDYMTGIQYIDYTSSEFLNAYPISEKDDYCNHNYKLDKQKAASCNVYGYTVYKCSICGETYEDTIMALNHDWDETKMPTCTTTGTWVCKNCGDTEVAHALGHDYQVKETVEPTCLEDGYTVYACSRCRHEHTSDITSSLGGHDYVLEDHKDMMHDEDGYDIYKCSVCGEEYTETYPAVPNHVFDDGFEAQEYSDTCGYDYIAECAICGKEEYIFSSLHDFEETGKDDEKECKYCGMVINADGEFVEYDEDFTPHDCEGNHTEVTVKAVDASCLEPGHEELTRCSACGKLIDVEKDVFSKPAGHTYDTYSIDATCTENGHEGYEYCTVCHEVKSYGTVIPAHGHTLVTEKGQDATCTQHGVTDEVYCRVCDYVEEEPETIEALGHDDDFTAAKEASCTEEGNTEGVVCLRCGYVFEEAITIPANGHDWVTVEEAVEKTCTEDGKKALIQCAVCGVTDPDADGSIIPAGHNLTHMEYLEPTEYEDGNIEFWYCHDCDECFLDEDATEIISFEDTVLTWTPTTSNPDGDGNDGNDGNDGDGNDGDGDTDSSGTGENTDNGSSGSDSNTVSGSESGDPSSSSSADSAETVKTGDSYMMYWILGAAALLLIIGCVLVFRRRKNNNNTADE